MHRQLQHAVFAAGLAAIGWVAAGYAGHSLLALSVTLLIALAYLAGALELRRFRAATQRLSAALAALPAQAPSAVELVAWLQALPATLRQPVRLRIEGERSALPGPALTPYLTGLLVLLGMLGTFLGMVVTLNGTGLALETATDLQAIRASLAAPVKGLGLAFGTSVAGVAASAMLGLLSALCRRERQQAVQALDVHIAGSLRVHSRAHQRDEGFRLLRQQADAMPLLVDRLQALMDGLEHRHATLAAQLAGEQARFHGQAEQAYAGLAASVARSLDSSLTESARLAGATIRPVVQATMDGIARETAALHGSLAQGLQQQLDGLSARLEAAHGRLADEAQARLQGFGERFEQRSQAMVEALGRQLGGSVAELAGGWQAALAEHQRSGNAVAAELQRSLAAAAGTFAQQSAALLQSVERVHDGLQTRLAAADAERLAAWTQQLDGMATALQQAFSQAGDRTLAEIATLLQAAAEAPRAAAAVIGELRDKLSDSMARDNTMLDERNRLLQTLGTLLDAVNHASTDQRAAIDALVASASGLMERTGRGFADTAEQHGRHLAEVAAQVTGSAVEVASLGEAFGAAVQQFAASNDQLGAQLQRIEAALGQSMARSDEQLAYYVAQAREVIDLSILSQKQIVEDLQQLGRGALAGSEA